jgi:hypothetical protein
MNILPKRPVLSNWRFELKYRLSPQQYHQVHSALVPYMEPDPYTRGAPSGLYLVRSLYYDTYDYKAYHEKMGGDYGRTKLRIRAYTNDPGENQPVRVELKTRRGSAMEKFSIFVPGADGRTFLETRHWPRHDSPVLTEFERLLHLWALRPKLLVEYQREGLQSRQREDLRITFDHHVHSTASSSLFPQHPFFRKHHPHTIILEIKCRNEQPQWLTKLIKTHRLKFVANSKYTQGIEISRPDAVTPTWSSGYVDTPVEIFRPLQKPATRTPKGWNF